MLMKLRWLRLFLLSVFSKKNQNPLDAVETNFLISPFDLDFTATASSAYGEFSMLSRWDHLFQNLSLYKLYREGNIGLGYSEAVRFRRATKLFDQLRVVSQIIYWDERMLYIQHKMYVKNELKAISLCRLAGMNKTKGRIAPRDIFPGLGGFDGAIPEVVVRMNETNEAINQL